MDSFTKLLDRKGIIPGSLCGAVQEFSSMPGNGLLEKGGADECRIVFPVESMNSRCTAGRGDETGTIVPEPVSIPADQVLLPGQSHQGDVQVLNDTSLLFSRRNALRLTGLPVLSSVLPYPGVPAASRGYRA